MKQKRIVVFVVAAATSLGLFAGSAQAAGCLSGAVAGAAVGHVAGHHAVLGAIAGCAIGHHVAKEQKRKRAQDSARADWSSK